MGCVSWIEKKQTEAPSTKENLAGFCSFRLKLATARALSHVKVSTLSLHSEKQNEQAKTVRDHSWCRHRNEEESQREQSR